MVMPNLKSWELEAERRKGEKPSGTAAPKATQPVSVGSSAWVAELEAALRHAKSARDGIETRDGNKTATYGLNGAIGLLCQAIESERSRSATEKLTCREPKS